MCCRTTTVYRDWQRHVAWLCFVGGAIGVIVGMFRSMPSAELVVLGGGAFTTIGALALAMRLGDYRWEHPRGLATAGGGLIVVYLALIIAVPPADQRASRLVLLFSPAAFASGVILLSTGASVLWRRWKQR